MGFKGIEDLNDGKSAITYKAENTTKFLVDEKEKIIKYKTLTEARNPSVDELGAELEKEESSELGPEWKLIEGMKELAQIVRESPKTIPNQASIIAISRAAVLVTTEVEERWEATRQRIGSLDSVQISESLLNKTFQF